MKKLVFMWLLFIPTIGIQSQTNDTQHFTFNYLTQFRGQEIEVYKDSTELDLLSINIQQIWYKLRRINSKNYIFTGDEPLLDDYAPTENQVVDIELDVFISKYHKIPIKTKIGLSVINYDPEFEYGFNNFDFSYNTTDNKIMLIVRVNHKY